jgi:hypothetical protein
MPIDLGARDAARTGATVALGIHLEVGWTEACRVRTTSTGRPSDHAGLPVADEVELGTAFAPATSAIHDEVGRQRLLIGQLLFRQLFGCCAVGGAPVRATTARMRVAVVASPTL